MREIRSKERRKERYGYPSCRKTESGGFLLTGLAVLRGQGYAERTYAEWEIFIGK